MARTGEWISVSGMNDPELPLWRPADHDSRQDYWEGVHDGKPVDGLSWWQSVPELSLGLVDATGISPDTGVIDVGAGWSTLVDHLLERGYTDLTAIDLSATALRTVRERLGAPGSEVRLELADVLDLDLGRRFGLWHDRAVFHFLTEPSLAGRLAAPGGLGGRGDFRPGRADNLQRAADRPLHPRGTRRRVPRLRAGSYERRGPHDPLGYEPAVHGGAVA